MQFYEESAAVGDFSKPAIAFRTNPISKIICGDSLCCINVYFFAAFRTDNMIGHFDNLRQRNQIKLIKSVVP